MKKLFAALLLAVACTSMAAPISMVATVDGVVVTLTKDPCTDEKVLATLASSVKEQYQSPETWAAGLAVFADHTRQICWTVIPEAPGEVGIIDDHGIVGGLPMTAFAPQEGV